MLFTSLDEKPVTSVGYDKAHCEPSNEVKMNQWVCALTL